MGEGGAAVNKCSNFSVELLNYASECYADERRSGNLHPDGKSK